MTGRNDMLDAATEARKAAALVSRAAETVYIPPEPEGKRQWTDPEYQYWYTARARRTARRSLASRFEAMASEAERLNEGATH